MSTIEDYATAYDKCHALSARICGYQESMQRFLSNLRHPDFTLCNKQDMIGGGADGCDVPSDWMSRDEINLLLNEAEAAWSLMRELYSRLPSNVQNLTHPPIVDFGQSFPMDLRIRSSEYKAIRCPG